LPLNSPAPLQSPAPTRSRPDKPAAAATIPHACCRRLQPKREQPNQRYGDVLSSCIDRAKWEEVVEATDDVAGQLWSYGSSSFHGHNDKVSEAATGDIDYSLILIEPTTLTLIVGPESQYMAGPRRRIRASFTFNNIRYNFVVTDPWVEAKYFAGNDGRYEINESRICISLPEIFNGTSTKLVATVITPERCTEK